MPGKVELLSCGTKGLLVVLGFGEKIDSEDGQRNGFERGAFFFFLGIIGFYVLSGFIKKKKKTRICFLR